MDREVAPPRTSELVRSEVRAWVLTITLDRPSARNALNRQMREDLAALLECATLGTEPRQRDAGRNSARVKGSPSSGTTSR